MALAAPAAQKFLARPDPAIRAALIFGPNRSRVAEAAADLTRRIVGPSPDTFAVARLYEDDLRKDKAALVDALLAQPLLGDGGARLVRVRCEGDAAADIIAAALTTLTDSRASGAFLLVEAGDLASRSKLRAAFERAEHAVAIVFYEESAQDLARYAADAAQRIPLEPGALEAVLATLPGDRGVICAELDKLALYAHGLGRAVTPAEALALCAGEADAELDEALAFALAGDGARAVEAFERSGAAGVSAIKAAERKLLRLMEAQALIGAGATPQETLTRLRPPVFWKEKDAFLQQLRTWREGRLAVALDKAWRAEIAAKQGGAPQELIAAQLCREIARLAKAGGA